jgi:hypothetical protein
MCFQYKMSLKDEDRACWGLLIARKQEGPMNLEQIRAFLIAASRRFDLNDGIGRSSTTG